MQRKIISILNFLGKIYIADYYITYQRFNLYKFIYDLKTVIGEEYNDYIESISNNIIETLFYKKCCDKKVYDNLKKKIGDRGDVSLVLFNLYAELIIYTIFLDFKNKINFSNLDSRTESILFEMEDKLSKEVSSMLNNYHFSDLQLSDFDLY